MTAKHCTHHSICQLDSNPNPFTTEITEQSFTQIVDSLPLKEIAFSLRWPEYTTHGPVLNHNELCSGALAKTSASRDSFNVHAMDLRTMSFGGTKMSQLDRVHPSSRL
ncbi:hypothetical protein N8I77_002573 [Diaporthe amygdali]|uniref:Uncharacterized protein n=1 Tax=Phomopsis amygdali TaxID=1214568 RepID=A0AAD9SR71_PHOAM|nr:hypothetical protein N8I77_002573 [Diaporthe amygdali]